MGELWYVYTLADNGKVFYVGISRNVRKRYRQHLSCFDLNTGDVIYWIRQDRRLPNVEILNCVRTQREAEIAETSIIRHLCITGNKLCNIDVNPKYNRTISCTPYPHRESLPRFKRHIVPELLQAAFDRFNKLTFYYTHDENDRLQYLGNSANIGQ